jgi:chitodextrinase
MWASPVFSDGRIYIGSQSDIFYCLNATTGAIIWSENLGADIDATAAIANGKVYITNLDGKIYCFAKSNDIIPPKVTSVSPKINAFNVPIDSNISAIFSEDVDPSSVNPSTVIVRNSTNGQISGTVNYDDPTRNMTFNPNSDLEFNEVYTVTLTTGIRDMVGNPLDGDGDDIMEGSPIDDYKWSFNTGTLKAPKINTIPQQTPTEDIEHILDLSPYIIDPDTSITSQTFLDNSSYVSVIGYNLSFLYPNGILYDTVNLSVNDGFATVYRDIDVVVTPVNDAPSINAISSLEALEDVNATLNVSPYISDIDNLLSELTISTNSSYDTIDGFEITFNYPEGILYELVRVTVSDGDLTNFTDVTIDVAPVNDPPTLSNPVLTPTNGDTRTKFTYSVIYTDIEDSAPNSVRVLIDSTPFVMDPASLTDKTFFDGVLYEYKTTLSAGTYTYKFDCSDGGENGLAETAIFNGPTVLELGRGGVQGTVSSKATADPIPSATISITDTANASIKFTVIADAAGVYSKMDLEPGTYELYASALGYKISDKVQKTVEAGKITAVYFELQELEGPPPDKNDTAVTNPKIIASKLAAKTGDSIAFTGSAEDPDGDVLTYQWNFGDGSKDEGKDVNHTYTVTGSYVVTLSVTDEDGTIASTTVVLVITKSTAPFDTAVENVRIQANRTEIYAGESISFEGFADDLDGDILTYTWYFGDDTAYKTGKTVKHTFEKAGKYTVYLNVTDTDNSFGVASEDIEVANKPKSEAQSESGALNTMTISLIAIVIIIIILIIVAVLFMRSKKKKEAVPGALPPPPLQPAYAPTEPLAPYPGQVEYPPPPPAIPVEPGQQYPEMAGYGTAEPTEQVAVPAESPPPEVPPPQAPPQTIPGPGMAPEQQMQLPPPQPQEPAQQYQEQYQQPPVLVTEPPITEAQGIPESAPAVPEPPTQTEIQAQPPESQPPIEPPMETPGETRPIEQAPDEKPPAEQEPAQAEESSTVPEKKKD